MGDKSQIEWTDATWNPVTGCTKVSPGCAYCYAEGVADRFWAKQYAAVPDGIGSDANYVSTWRPRRFTDLLTHDDRLDQPFRWRKPRRTFVNSMSDLFHEAVPDKFIDQVLAVMALAPQHQFQVLTKRAVRMRDYFLSQPSGGRQQAVVKAAVSLLPEGARVPWLANYDGVWPLQNCWLGVSVENQRMADERIPLLRQTVAAVRFLSCEPLLEALDIRAYLEGDEEHGTPFSGAPTVGGCVKWTPPVDWVIVGGESGPQSRRCDLVWIRSIVEQCKAAAVPCFVKQLGANVVDSEYLVGVFAPEDRRTPKKPDGAGGVMAMANLVLLHDRKGGDPNEWPHDLRVREWPGVEGLTCVS